MPRRPDVVVLLSGGLDSIVLAHHALAVGRLRAVAHYVYPHPAQSQERRAVSEVCRQWHLAGHYVERAEFPITLHAHGELGIGVGVEGPRVVPGRNLVFLSHAVNYAAGIGATEIWDGATAEDMASYPDCRPDFVATVSGMAAAWGIAVRAPFIDKNRAEIVQIGESSGAPLHAAWSCYQPTPTGRACGTCDSCRQDTP